MLNLKLVLQVQSKDAFLANCLNTKAYLTANNDIFKVF